MDYPGWSWVPFLGLPSACLLSLTSLFRIVFLCARPSFHKYLTYWQFSNPATFRLLPLQHTPGAERRLPLASRARSLLCGTYSWYREVAGCIKWVIKVVHHPGSWTLCEASRTNVQSCRKMGAWPWLQPARWRGHSPLWVSDLWSVKSIIRPVSVVCKKHNTTCPVFPKEPEEGSNENVGWGYLN